LPALKQHQDRIFLGSFLVIISVFLIASMGAIAKSLSTDIHPIELAFYRNMMVFLGMLIFLIATRRYEYLKTKRHKAHIIRSLIGTIGLICGFWSISLLPLATAFTLYNTAPLFVVLLSGPILKEFVGPMRYLAVVVGFIGVLFVIQPSGQDLVILGLVFAFFDALSSALTKIYLRDLGKTENSFITVFYYMGIGVITTALLLPFFWSGIPKSEHILFLIGLGLTGWLQQISKTKGYAMAPVSVTAPLAYTGIIWGVIFGWLFWDTLPTFYVILGACIIVASNLFIVYRENKKNTNA